MNQLRIARLGRSTFVVALLLAWLPVEEARAQSVFEKTYRVERGTVLEGCGGITSGCRQFRIEGKIEIRVDRDTGQAVLSSEDLELTEAGTYTTRLALPLTELTGRSEGEEIRFETVSDSLQDLDWQLTRNETGLVLQGFFDEGCCDRFRYDFRNVSFHEVAILEPSYQLMLDRERFGVEVRYEDFEGEPGDGKAVEQGADSGYFWFFDAANTEVVVKIVDACETFGRYWFFAAGMTNLEVEIVVRDYQTGAERRYRNPGGRKFETILDVDAFATCD